jgi:hypothetical protein
LASLQSSRESGTELKTKLHSNLPKGNPKGIADQCFVAPPTPCLIDEESRKAESDFSNPKGIAASSPGLRQRRYPGWRGHRMKQPQGGCASIPHIAFIEFDFMLPQKRPQLILKRQFPVMFLLVGDVYLYLFKTGLADREIRVTALPLKIGVIPALLLVVNR